MFKQLWRCSISSGSLRATQYPEKVIEARGRTDGRVRLYSTPVENAVPAVAIMGLLVALSAGGEIRWSR